MTQKESVIDCGAGFTKALFSEIAPLAEEIHRLGYSFAQNMSQHNRRKFFERENGYDRLCSVLDDFMEEADPEHTRSTPEVSEQVLNPDTDAGMQNYMLLLLLGAQFLHNSLNQQLMLTQSVCSKFLRFLSALRDSNRVDIASFITTNYDQVLDILVFNELNPVPDPETNWRTWKPRYAYGDTIYSQINRFLTNSRNIVSINPSHEVISNHIDRVRIPIIKLNGSVNWLWDGDEIVLPLGQNVLFENLLNDRFRLNLNLVPPLPPGAQVDDVAGNELPRKDLIEEAGDFLEEADTLLSIGHSFRDGADQQWLEELREIWRETAKTFIFVIQDQHGNEERRLRGLFPDRNEGQQLYVFSEGLESFIDDALNNERFRSIGL